MEGLAGFAFVVVFEDGMELEPHCLHILEDTENVIALECTWMYACTAHAYGEVACLIDNADGEPVPRERNG